MSWLTYVAVFFVAWWIVLFAILPMSLRTQDEEGDVTLGTVPSAPRGPHIARAMLRTTFVTIILFAIYIGLTTWLGVGIGDIPSIVPSFE